MVEIHLAVRRPMYSIYHGRFFISYGHVEHLVVFTSCGFSHVEVRVGIGHNSCKVGIPHVNILVAFRGLGIGFMPFDLFTFSGLGNVNIDSRIDFDYRV